MSESALVAAQAKLNLHLRVLSREESGYHSIETVFHRVDLADEILVTTTRSGRSIDVEGADTGPPEANLAWRAAGQFQDRARWPDGFAIELRKHIPVGAGMGGGSADAAAVLRALNFLAPRPLPPQDLLAIASRLGADVPFLASSATMAVAWGRGERMLKVDPLPIRDVVIVTAGFAVSTAEAYRWLDEERSADGEGSAPALLLAPDDLSSWERIGLSSANDFEKAVGARYPRLSETIEALGNAGAEMTRMTGSGSAVFGVARADSGASEIVGRLPAELQRRAITTRTSSDVVPPVRQG